MVTAEIAEPAPTRRRTKVTFDGSLTRTPNGVTLPSASPITAAVNAALRDSRRGSSGHIRPATARSRHRTPPSRQITTNHQPIRLMASRTAETPAARMDQKNNSAPLAPAATAAERRLRFAARACHSSFSSAVHALQHQKLAWNRLLPVTPEVASSSLVDPAIYLKVQHLHC